MGDDNKPAPGAATTPAGTSAVALMYHALGAGVLPEGQDPHYTLEDAAFSRHLALLRDIAGGAGCARDWLLDGHGPDALLTFDDGHESNHRIAFPALAGMGMRADFFVNPGNVGRRGYATWTQLREMSAAGMSIQSHGYDHVYLTHLGASLRSSLEAARKAIEDGVGAPVTLLAPPGGRVTAGIARIARECGYLHVLGSRPGRLVRRPGGVLPRMSVNAGTGEATLRRWLSGEPGALLRETARYAALAGAKRLLGDARYERMRTTALAQGGR